MENRVVSYAQNREDVILAGFFPEDYKGFYVDVGANHPVYDSVTKYFYERGWRGINIEPNPKLFELLEGDRPEDVNLCVGVSSKSGTDKITIYDKGHGLSTMSKEMRQEHRQKKLSVTRASHVETIQIDTLENIFKKQGVTSIDFLKIDVEGFENEVIKGNNWQVYRPKIICIEANHILDDWRPALAEAKYEEAFFDGLNSYYVAYEAKDLADSFSYVQSIIGRDILSLKWNQELVHQSSLRRGQELENQALLAQKESLEREVAQLSNRRLRVIIKELLLKIDEIVRLRIERFNKPKPRGIKKQSLIKEDDIKKAANSRKAILKLVRKNDLTNFYNSKTSGHGYRRMYLYETLLFMYNSFKRGIIFVLKLMFRVMRRVKRSVR